MIINCSPITESPYYATERKSLDISGAKKSIVLLAIPVVLFLSFGVVLVAWLLNGNIALMAALGLLAVFTFTVPFVVLWLITKLISSRKQVAANRAAMQQFAERNGLSYRPAPTVLWGQEEPLVPMELPYKDTEVSLFEGFAGKLGAWPFDYGNYIVRLATDRRNTGGRSLTILRLQLPIAMPRLLANSRHNNLLDFDPRPDNFGLQEEQHLEGDFPRYYTVHVERADRISALAVLSPEVMQALKEHAYFDVWIHDQELMLITSGVNFFPTIPDAFKTVEVLMKEIDLIARSARTTPPPAPITPDA